METEISPFESLGLTPSLIRLLSPDEIKKVAKTMWRNLQAVYHIDKPTGDAKISNAVNIAHDKIESATEEGVERLKSDYLQNGPGQQRIKKLEDEYAQLAKNELILADKKKGTETDISNVRERFSSEQHNEHGNLVSMFNSFDDEIVETPHVPVAFLRSTTIELQGSENETKLYMLQEQLKDLKYKKKETRKRDLELIRASRTHLRSYRNKNASDAKKTVLEIERLRKKINWENQEIENLKRKIKKARDAKFTVTVDDNGVLTDDRNGKRYKKFFGSSAIEPTAGITDDPIFELCTDMQLCAIGGNGSITILGIILDSPVFDKAKKRIEKRIKDRIIKSEEERRTVKSDQKEQTGDRATARDMDNVKALVLKDTSSVNPIEKIGLLPWVAVALSIEQLTELKNNLGKKLQTILHPDVADPRRRNQLGEINNALSHLKNPDNLTAAWRDYKDMEVQEEYARSIRRAIKEKQDCIRILIDELVKLEIELSAKKQEMEKEEKEEKKLYEHYVHNFFGAEMHPKHPGEISDAYYVSKTDGFRVKLDMEGVERQLTLKVRGFFSYVEGLKSELMVVGCIPINKKSEEIKGKFEEQVTFEHRYFMTSPFIVKDSYLVVRKNDDAMPFILGKIREINSTLLETGITPFRRPRRSKTEPSIIGKQKEKH